MKTSILLLLSAVQAFAQPISDDKLTARLTEIREASGYPGIVFSVVEADGTAHTIVSGWADKEAGVAMTGDHLLHSGSTGKVVVSAVLLQLVHQGKLELDDPMKKYLGKEPWYSQLPNAETITIRHLMQHTSGIVRYEFKDEFLGDLANDADRVWKPEELISYVLGDTAAFEAGKGFTYADTNYILLGMIIEKVTGKKFYDLAQKQVLDPLKLNSFTPTNTRIIPGMAQGYFDPASEYALGFKSPFLVNGVAQNNMQFEWTGGGYAYKTKEYAQLLKAIHEGKVFNLSKVGADFYGTVPSPEIGGAYGLGVHEFEFKDLGTFYGHDGFFPGYYTIGLYHPESRMAFAMQINSTDMPHLRSFFKDYLMMVREVLSE